MVTEPRGRFWRGEHPCVEEERDLGFAEAGEGLPEARLDGPVLAGIVASEEAPMLPNVEFLGSSSNGDISNPWTPVEG